MKLRITEIADRGDAQRERIVMKADEDIDIGDFAIFMARRSSKDGKVRSGNIPHCFWFEDKEIKAGSTVVLYTKAGTRSEKENSSGKVSYFFYWGLDAPRWTEIVRPVLVQTPSWAIFKD
jgi:hypothetical protein